MQTTRSVPVRYGPTSEVMRGSDEEAYRRLEDEDSDDESLPEDPRHWSRSHVALWLAKMSAHNGFPEVPISRFMMNGKALCLMSPKMFVDRVPIGGMLLYKDFRLRLCAAMYSKK